MIRKKLSFSGGTESKGSDRGVPENLLELIHIASSLPVVPDLSEDTLDLLLFSGDVRKVGAVYSRFKDASRQLQEVQEDFSEEARRSIERVDFSMKRSLSKRIRKLLLYLRRYREGYLELMPNLEAVQIMTERSGQLRSVYDDVSYCIQSLSSCPIDKLRRLL